MTRGSREQAKFAAFQAEVAAEGRAAQKLADARIATEIARKVESDASYRKALTLAGADIERLRKSSADRYIVPAPGPVAGSVDTRACFDAEQLDTAIREFAQGAAGLVGRGETMRLRLDAAINWAR